MGTLTAMHKTSSKKRERLTNKWLISIKSVTYVKKSPMPNSAIFQIVPKINLHVIRVFMKQSMETSLLRFLLIVYFAQINYNEVSAQ